MLSRMMTCASVSEISMLVKPPVVTVSWKHQPEMMYGFCWVPEPVTTPEPGRATAGPRGVLASAKPWGPSSSVMRMCGWGRQPNGCDEVVTAGGSVEGLGRSGTSVRSKMAGSTSGQGSLSLSESEGIGSARRPWSGWRRCRSSWSPSASPDSKVGPVSGVVAAASGATEAIKARATMVTRICCWDDLGDQDPFSPRMKRKNVRRYKMGLVGWVKEGGSRRFLVHPCTHHLDASSHLWEW
jgi:hypothetical protein